MKKEGAKLKSEPAVFIHLKPTREELRLAYLEQFTAQTLQHLPEWMRDLSGWMSYLHPKPGQPRSISFCPVVIEVNGRYPAVIYLTDWRERGQSAQAHFAAHARYMPKTVFSACRLAIGMLLRSPEINLLEVCCEETNERALKMAKAMGFIEAARVAGCVHSLKTAKGDIYGAITNKTETAGKGGRSGDTGKRGSTGGGRSGAPSAPAAAGAEHHLPG